ncbi:MAG: cytochrome D ubiquinol oxidase subunit II, partial [Planctomycetes bacterium]|nr:cytochrome D ubiquinol oxidase subunit II [Planctomycetota bacterium]
QTKRMQEIPIVLFGKDYWTRVIDFQFLADEGVIADEHLDLISFAETPDEAWDIVARFHRRHRSESGDAVEPGGS